MGHIERKQRERENTKNSILKAALDIAIAEGWTAVTIRRISEKIEYTTSIVYSHFENKEALLLEIVDQGFEKLYKYIMKSLKNEDDPKKQIMIVSLANWDFAMTNRELYNLMFNLNRPSGDNATKGMQIIEDIFFQYTGKSRDEVEHIVLNWICLRRGCLNLLIDFSMQDKETDSRQLYIEFMSRFIYSITPN